MKLDLAAMMGRALEGLAPVKRGLERTRNEIESKEARRKYLQEAPISREDYIATVHRDVDNAAENYRKDLRSWIEDVGRVHAQPLSSWVTRSFSTFWWQPPKGPGFIAAAMSASDIPRPAMAFLFGDLIKEATARAIREECRDWPEAGPPIAARVEELKRLDAELKQLRDEEQRIVARLREIADVV